MAGAQGAPAVLGQKNKDTGGDPYLDQRRFGDSLATKTGRPKSLQQPQKSFSVHEKTLRYNKDWGGRLSFIVNSIRISIGNRRPDDDDRCIEN